MYTDLIAVVDEQLTETVSMILPGPWTKRNLPLTCYGFQRHFRLNMAQLQKATEIIKVCFNIHWSL